MHKAQARVADAVRLIERLSKGKDVSGERHRGASHNLVALEGAIAHATARWTRPARNCKPRSRPALRGWKIPSPRARCCSTRRKDRTDAFTGLLSQGAVLFDNTLKQRTDALTVAIAEAQARSTSR